MSTFMKSCVSLLLVFILFVQYAFLSVIRFSMEVTPNPLKVWEAADVKIQALDAAGALVKDYQWVILIDFEGAQDTTIYDIPSNGFYQFVPADLWEKTFSKWLVVRKSGQFTLKVYDSWSEEIVWSTMLMVWDTAQQTTTKKTIDIVEPMSGAVVNASALHVIGTVENKLTPLEFYINGEKIDIEWESDATGNFAVYLPMLPAWRHILQVKMLDYRGTVIGESDEISFTYAPPQTDNFLKSFVVTPNGDVNPWTQITFTADTDTTVRSMEIVVWTIGTFVMDREAVGKFTKTIVVDKPWVHRVDATVIFEWWQRTPYIDRAVVNVLAKDIVDIGLVRVVNDPADPSKVSLSRDIVWQPSSYIVRYGAAQDSLNREIKTTQMTVDIPELEIGKQYFFQVFAVDAEGNVVGKWSDIASLITAGQSAAGVSPVTCQVVGIDLTTKKIGDKYFLVRDEVENVVEYHIYKADYEVASIETMQKIGTTTIPQFEYPFDPTAQEDQYTYYAVVATCADGTNLQIDGVKKVHTWPFSDMLMLLFVSLLFYSLYRVYRFSS